VVVANGLHRGYYAPQAFSGLTLLGRTAPLILPEGFGDALSVRLASQPANDAAMRIGMHAIRSDPAGYARLALRHVVGMWSWPWISTEERMAPVLATLRQPDLHAFLGRKAKASNLWLVPEAVYEAKLGAAAIAFALCVGACAAAVLASGRNPALSLAGAAGLAVIGYDLLVGCVQFADNRYAYAILPVVLLALSACAATIADAVHASRREALPHRTSSVRQAN
jgi:hypothetical protein